MSARDKVIRALWARGELSYKLRPEQRLLLAMLHDMPLGLAVFNISRRFGKSTTCVTYAVERAIRAKRHVRYATAFLTDLEQFIMPIFEWVLSDCPEREMPVWNATKKTWTLPNGSTIKLVGLDKNPNGLRGNNIDDLVVDEAGFVANLAYLYRSVIIPATMKRKFKLIFPSTPPESPEHFWAKELIDKARARNTYVELTIDDISDLPAEERQRLLDEVGGEHGATAQREFFCKILVDETLAVCPTFDQTQHVAPVDRPHIAWGLFGDTGGSRDMTAIYDVGWDRETGKVLFRSELVFSPKTPTTVVVASIKERWPERRTLVLDAPGQLLIDYSAAGLPACLPPKDDFAAGLLLLRNAFYKGEVLVDPSCKLLIRTLAGGLLNKQRTDYERTESLGHCDAAAAAIYALRGVDRTTDLRPRPKAENIFYRPQDPPHIQQLKGLTWKTA